MAESKAGCGIGKKRKLMPMKKSNVDSPSGSPIDSNPRETVKVDCPYLKKERRKFHKCDKSKTNTSLDGALLNNVPARNFRESRQPCAPLTRTMVCTFMHRKDADRVSQAVKKLGGWEMEASVSPRTTHVICGEEKRTVKVMLGIAYGCWIVRSEWVKQSIIAGCWINEEPFEVLAFPAIRQCRIRQETVKSASDIFSNGEKYYVSKKSSPPYSDLKNILQLCGANIVVSAKKADVVVGPIAINLLPGIVRVNEKWVLDSIADNVLKEKTDYLS